MNRTLRTAVLGLLLIVAMVLVVGACRSPTPEPPIQPGPPAPGDRPPAEPGEAPADTGEPAPADTDESVPYSATLGALAALDSFEYEFSWIWEGSTAGTFQSGSFRGSGQVQNQPSRAQHVVWNTADEEGVESSIEYVFIEDAGGFWLREATSGDWAPLTGVDPSLYEAFTLTGFLTPLLFSDAEDLAFVGTETVNGVEARHYSSGGFSFLFGLGCTVAQASDDVWEAIDLGVPVRHISRFSGSCGGGSAEWSFELNITKINGPVEVTPPI